jgi:hypothetical protein
VTILTCGFRYRYAVFVGGTDQSNAVSNAIDVWTVIGDSDPAAATAALKQARTAPTAAVIAKYATSIPTVKKCDIWCRYTQKPIVVVTGGDADNVKDGCQPATLAEFMVVDPSAAGAALRFDLRNRMMRVLINVHALQTPVSE